MEISKIKIVNYKIFKNVSIPLNPRVNIFVGENDSGKTTILEALSIALTGKLNGFSVMTRLTPDWFNYSVRQEYIRGIQAKQFDLPPIIIEVFFSNISENDSVLLGYKGTNNIDCEDECGVKVEIRFNDEYSSTYKQLLSEKKVSDIPVELYKIEFRSFSGSEYYINFTSKKVAIVDSTKKDYGSVLNKFISSSISEFMSEKDKTDLRIAYRGNRHDFTKSEAVKNLNSKIQSQYSFRDKTLSLNLRETEIDNWKSEMILSLDTIPLEYSGFGTQNIIKSELFLSQNEDVDILLFEEPENNLSFTNMSMLISKLTERKDKQVFISTHSSFVANKLGLNHLQLVSNSKVQTLKELSKDTFNYFVKLPGYNTLRVLLSNKIILVEGPADELIIQKAYKDTYQKLPIEDGIDVMSVGGVAFKRYCELANLVGKELTIVTDNDGDIEKVRNSYKEYITSIKLCVESDNTLNTLEPSFLNANKDNLETIKKIIFHGNGGSSKSHDEICEFMKKNKTEWSLRIFDSEERILYPQNILKAIEK